MECLGHMVNREIAVVGIVAEKCHRAPTENPREATSIETTRVASGSQAWRAMDHRRVEQYPVNNKIFTQLSSSGGME